MYILYKIFFDNLLFVPKFFKKAFQLKNQRNLWIRPKWWWPPLTSLVGTFLNLGYYWNGLTPPHKINLGLFWTWDFFEVEWPPKTFKTLQIEEFYNPKFLQIRPFSDPKSSLKQIEYKNMKFVGTKSIDLMLYWSK